MIDTVLLCIAWAVIGYALALIENEWEIAKYERDSHDDLSNARKELHTSKQFYQRRFDLLQKAQRQRNIAQAPPGPLRVLPLQAVPAQWAVYDLLVRLGPTRISSPMRRIRPEARPLTY